MKKSGLCILFQITATFLTAQWTQVNTGLPGTHVTSLYAFADTLFVGTDGSGIFKTVDHGTGWIDISGNIGTLYINRIVGAGSSRFIMAATDAGPYNTYDLANYTNSTSTGLTSTEVTFYGFGGDDDRDWVAGTRGGGLFTSSEMTGPWTPVNNGISGDGLNINDFGGYSDDSNDFLVLATEGGIYFTEDNMTTWIPKNSGLSGDALKVRSISLIGSGVILATRSGLYFVMNLGTTYYTLLPSEKLNVVSVLPKLSGGVETYAFGENGFYSPDIMNYFPIDMSGVIGGEVTCMARNSEYLFVGTETGGVFRKPLGASAGPTAEFTASPTSGPVPLTVYFTDASIETSGAGTAISLNKNRTGLKGAITTWQWDFDNDGVVDSNLKNPHFTYTVPDTYTVNLTVSDGTDSDTMTKAGFITALADPPSVTADFTASPLSGETPLTVTFSDASSAVNTTIISWEWDFDSNGAIDDSTQNPAWQFAAAGTYTVSLTVSDGTLTDTETKSAFITVLTSGIDSMTAEFSAIPQTGTVPLTVTFTDQSVSSAGTISTWSWDFDNDGTEDATQQNPIFTYSAAGTYTVALTVSDGTLTETETKTNYITVSPAGTASMTAAFTGAPVSGFAPLTVRFTDHSTASGTTITAWNWDFNNDGIADATQQNPVFTYTAADTCSVKLTVTDGSLSDDVTVTDYIRATAFHYPAQIPAAVSPVFPSHTDIRDFQSADYRLFGLPGNSGQLLETVIPGDHETVWQAYADNGSASNYLIKYDRSAAFNLTAGKAFWLLHNGPVTISRNLTAAALDASYHARIPLHSGWNLITNPFTASVSWLEVQTENTITGLLYGYASGYTVSAGLEPYQGYYYFNNTALTELKIPYYAAVSKMDRTGLRESNPFSICIRLTGPSDYRSEIILGMHENADPGLDPHDNRKPRTWGNSPEIYFLKPEWDPDYSIFYSDVRPVSEELTEWTFKVTPLKNKPAALSFDIHSQLPGNGPETALINWSTGEWTFIDSTSPVSVTGNSDELSLSILTGGRQEIAAKMAEAVPADYALMQNYPNPFNLKTRFIVSCPAETRISVHIYNAVGRKIRTLFNGSLTAGNHQMTWNGLDDSGLESPSGIYILSVNGGNRVALSKKLILMK